MRKYLWILWCLSRAIASAGTFDDEVPHNKVFKSPDGRFETSEAVLISDHVTGKVQGVPVMVPILALEWSQDSRTIVIVSHLAGGSYGIVLHFNGTEWTKTEADPTSPERAYYLAYEVIKTYLSPSAVSFTYRVSAKQDPSDSYRRFCCEVTIDTKSWVRKERRVACR